MVLHATVMEECVSQSVISTKTKLSTDTHGPVSERDGHMVVNAIYSVRETDMCRTASKTWVVYTELNEAPPDHIT